MRARGVLASLLRGVNAPKSFLDRVGGLSESTSDPPPDPPKLNIDAATLAHVRSLVLAELSVKLSQAIKLQTEAAKDDGTLVVFVTEELKALGALTSTQLEDAMCLVIAARLAVAKDIRDTLMAAAKRELKSVPPVAE